MNGPVAWIVRPVAGRVPAIGAVALLAATVVVSGCQAPQRQARAEARRRWRLARAEVTAKLAGELLRAGQLTDALEELDKARSLNPEDPKLRLLEARIALARADLPAAETALDEIPPDSPVQAEAQYLRGVLAQQQGRWQRAERYYRAALALAPDDAAAATALVQVLLQQGRTDDALDVLERHGRRLGRTAAYQAALAETYEQRGQFDEAARAWRKVVMRCGAADARYRLALALFCAGRYDEAREVVEDLLDDPPATASVELLKILQARCLLYGGEPAEAQRRLEALLRQQPRNVRALIGLAEVMLVEGHTDRAAALADQAGALAPDDPQVLELRAALRMAAGDRGTALRLARQLRRRQPGSPIAREILSRLAAAD